MSYIPVTVDTATLLYGMKRSEVFVCRPSTPNKRATFYKYTFSLLHLSSFLGICFLRLQLLSHKVVIVSFIWKILNLLIYQIKVAHIPV